VGTDAKLVAVRPGRRERHLHVLERRQRRDQVELLEHEAEGAEPQLGKVPVG